MNDVAIQDYFWHAILVLKIIWPALLLGILFLILTMKGQTMSLDHDALQADLQALADKHQAHLLVTATPVDVEDQKFDVTASPVV